MVDKITIVVVDDIPATLESLKKLFLFEEDLDVVGTASDGEQAVALVKQLHPDIVLMDINMPKVDGIRAAETLSVEAPSSPVIIMSVQGENAYLKRAMQAGAREFLVKPFSSSELISTIRRVHEMETKKGTYERMPTPTASSNGENHLGRVIVVFGAKGGVGKSVIATNLAVQMAIDTGKRVALVDLNLQFGDVGVLVNNQDTRSFVDLIDSINELSPEDVEDILFDGPGGVKVLQAPLSPELGDLVQPAHVERVLALLRTRFDFVICDSATSLNELTLSALDQADTILLVTALDILTIKNVRLVLDTFASLKIADDKIKLVLNRSNSETGITEIELERSLQYPIFAKIPSDGKLVLSSVNRGVPFVQLYPQAEITQRMQGLSIALAGVPAGTEEAAELALVKGKEKSVPEKPKARKGLFVR
jgi:pilus assembly protein CpaE